MLDHEIWLIKALSDLRSSKILFEEKVFDTSIYHTQQCAEKSLKSYLSSCDQFIPRTHNLEYLIKVCLLFDKEFECLMVIAVKLNPYAIRFRYPDDLLEPEIEDAKQAIIMAQRIFEFAEKKIQEIATGQKNIF